MDIELALKLTDELKPNQIERALKVHWLSELDGRIWREILMTHERDGRMPFAFSGYTPDTPEDTRLLVPSPYDSIYRFYLEMQIDLTNLELEKYNNSMALFNTAWGDFARAWHRTHMPLETARVHLF